MMANRRRTNIIWAFAGLCCLNLIASIDVTALSVCIPTIATDLNATSIQAYWTGTSFILASAVFQPVISALSAPFGRRPVIEVSLLLFAAGTVVCATAHHVATILAGRTLQGVGGGGLLTMTYVVMADLLTLRERAKGIAVISVVWIIGTCIGPIMGGAFTTHISWRWIFWVVLPLVGIGFVLIGFRLRTPHQPDYSAKRLKRVDWGGSVLFVVSLTSFLVAISWGGTQFAWNSYQTLVPLILGAAGLSWWLVYEYHIPSMPMVPLMILNNRTAVIGFLATLLMGIVQFSLLYFLPLYYEASKGYSPMIAGVALLPNCFGAGISAAILSRYIAKTGHYNIVTWVGWILAAAGCGILVLLDTHTSALEWIFLNVVSGLGLGCLFASLTIATQAPQREENMATGAALTPFFRTVGQAFGIAIGDAIYQNRLKHYLLHTSSPSLREQAENLAKNSASIVVVVSSIPDGLEDRFELLQAFNKSLHAIWWTMMGISILGGVISLFMKELPMDGQTGAGSGSGSGEDVEESIKSEELPDDGIVANGYRGNTVVQTLGMAM